MALLTYFMVMLSKKRGNGLVKLTIQLKYTDNPILMILLLTYTTKL